MVFTDRPFTFDRVIRITLTIGFIWGTILLLDYLSDVLIPFSVALLLAYMINPLTLVIEKKIPNRIASVFISLFIILIASTAIAWIIIPMIFSEIDNMSKVLSQVVNSSELAKRASKILPENIWAFIREFITSEEVMGYLNTENMISFLKTAAAKVLPGVWGVITGTASLVIGLVGLSIILLYLVFLLFDYDRVRKGWKELIPHPQREAITDFVKDVDVAMNRYFRAQATVAAIVGVLFAVGFSLIGLPMGILLGLFIGLLNMVPYLQTLGIPIALLLALFRALETNQNVWFVIGLTLLVFIVVQGLQDGFLVPKIMGDVTGLSPAVILLSLSIWGKLLGVFGLIIALPMTAILVAYYKRFLKSTEKKESRDNGPATESPEQIP